MSSQTSAFSHSGDRRLYAVFPSAFLFPGYFAALRRFNRGLREKKNGAELSGMSTIVGGTAKGLCPLVRHCLMVHAPFAIAKRLGCVASPLRGSVWWNVVSIRNVKTMLIPGRWLSGGFLTRDLGIMSWFGLFAPFGYRQSWLMRFVLTCIRPKLYSADCPWARNVDFGIPLSQLQIYNFL